MATYDLELTPSLAKPLVSLANYRISSDSANPCCHGRPKPRHGVNFGQPIVMERLDFRRVLVHSPRSLFHISGKISKLSFTAQTTLWNTPSKYHWKEAFKKKNHFLVEMND
jgi:hypothetical protein